MGTWPGYSIYVWLLTFMPMACYLILLNDDAKPEPRFLIDENDNEFFTADIRENDRVRGFWIRKTLAYVYLGSVFVSFMFGIFGSWGMGVHFWGSHCTLPRGCDRVHWRFIILLVIRVFFQFHVFWVLLCHSDKLKPMAEEEPIPECKPLIVQSQAKTQPLAKTGQLTLTVRRGVISDYTSNPAFNKD